MELYNMHKVDEETDFDDYDVFFCAAGLEARDDRVSLLLAQKRCIKQWVIFNYEEREQSRTGDLDSQAERLGSCLIVKTSYHDDRSYEEMLSTSGVQIAGNAYIGIDITGFKNQFFFPLIRFLVLEIGIKKLDIFYTEPATYRFPRVMENTLVFPNMRNEQPALFNYSKAEEGIEIKGISGFEGARSKETILVIVLGFDGKVAARVRDDYSAERIILINGFPSYLPKFRDISLLNNKELVNVCNPRDIYNTSSDNPFEIYNVLLKIQYKYPSHKLLIAPLGAKPLAMGVCKFAIDHSTSAVLYVESEKYNERSTYDYGDAWRYKVAFELK